MYLCVLSLTKEYNMDNKKFTLYHRLCAVFAFVVSAVTYLLTIEASASFWDCGEFIASSYKLEVGHPPGLGGPYRRGYLSHEFRQRQPHHQPGRLHDRRLRQPILRRAVPGQ